MVGCSKNTVQELLLDLGASCSEFMDEELRELPCKRVRVDEIWSFVYAKAKNVPQETRGQFGVDDVWTFIAIDADTKLVPCFLVGARDGGSATDFLQDLESRLNSRVQLTSDRHIMYLEAAEASFRAGGDHAVL